MTGLQKLFLDIGRAVAVLHDGGLVHGDLTTSNMLVRDADKAVVRSECVASLWHRSLPI